MGMNINKNVLTEKELIASTQKGDEKAFAKLVALYDNRLFRSAYAILANENDALEISQDAFVKAYYNITKFRGESSFYTWIYKIMYNLCLSHIRKKKMFSFFSIYDKSMENLPSKGGPSDTCENNEITIAVQNALEKLPLRQKTVFIMKQIDGLKHEEIARILDISEGAVKATYFHAVNKLKVLLNKYGEDYGM